VIRTRAISIAARDHALGRRDRQPGADKLDHQPDADAVRQHDRLSAAVRRRGEQFERAAAVGLGADGKAGRVRNP
jgi:hypothetical protein